MTPRERIQCYIKKEGYKQCAVAIKAGYGPRDFSLMMTGKRKMDLDDLERICKALNVGADMFIKLDIA